jgi:murein DD-endopeptidase MepM/ murein hydrolase activator NlpD
MTLHSFLTSARDLSARSGRWTRRSGHAVASRIAAHARILAARAHARTHAVAANLHARSAARPATAIAVLVAGGVMLGAGATQGISTARVAHLQARNDAQRAQLHDTRDEAQREVNALAARLGELQAEANRLNALGERLTRIGQLGDGEFDFNKPVGVGGEGPVHDMAAGDLRGGMDQLGAQLTDSGKQLSVLESLLFNRELDRSATPSRMPILNTYITSGYGGRADPFGGGRGFHKGIDFHARKGDPVLAVADGVVSYAGVRSGYGNVVEVDHGNGYVTRYAHNSRLVVRVGDLVRSGQQIAKAGSTGRSTGAHVHFEVWQDGRVLNPRKFLGEHAATKRM